MKTTYKRNSKYRQWGLIIIGVFFVLGFVFSLIFNQTKNPFYLYILGILAIYIILASINTSYESLIIEDESIVHKLLPLNRKFKFKDITLIRMPPNYRYSPIKNARDLVIKRRAYQIYRISIITGFENSQELIKKIVDICTKNNIELRDMEK